MSKAKHVNLKAFEKHHIPLLVKWLNKQPSNNKPFPGFTNVKAIERHYNDVIENNSTFAYVVHTSEPVGYCEISNIDWKNRSGSFKIYMDIVEEADKYLRDISYKLCSISFKDFGLNKLSCLVVVDNEALLTTLEDQGFSKEVRWRQHKFINGLYYNVIEMAILAAEFLNDRIKNNVEPD